MTTVFTNEKIYVSEVYYYCLFAIRVLPKFVALANSLMNANVKSVIY